MHILSILFFTIISTFWQSNVVVLIVLLQQIIGAIRDKIFSHTHTHTHIRHIRLPNTYTINVQCIILQPNLTFTLKTDTHLPSKCFATTSVIYDLLQALLMAEITNCFKQCSSEYLWCRPSLYDANVWSNVGYGHPTQ